MRKMCMVGVLLLAVLTAAAQKAGTVQIPVQRSEERRVGKECRL